MLVLLLSAPMGPHHLLRSIVGTSRDVTSGVGDVGAFWSGKQR